MEILVLVAGAGIPAGLLQASDLAAPPAPALAWTMLPFLTPRDGTEQVTDVIDRCWGCDFPAINR